MSVLLGILSGLLGLGKWALKALGALLGGLTRWVGADIRHAVIAGLVAVIGALVIFTIPGLRADLASQTARADREAQNADDWMASAEGWESEFHAFVDEVSAQQVAAAEADRANLARVEAEFAALNERTVDDYEARLAGSAAAAERLRNRLARAEAEPAAQSGSLGSAAGVPGAYTARCQAFGAADCDGLLQQLPWVLAEAQRNTDQLVALQHYVAGAALIDLSGEPDRSEPRDGR